LQCISKSISSFINCRTDWTQAAAAVRTHMKQHTFNIQYQQQLKNDKYNSKAMITKVCSSINPKPPGRGHELFGTSYFAHSHGV